MGVRLIDPATGVTVEVSPERAVALGWPTEDGTPFQAPDGAAPAEEAAEPVKASRPRKAAARTTKTRAASESEAAETW